MYYMQTHPNRYGPSSSLPDFPSHLRPVILKPVGRIFEISDSSPTQRKCGKCGRPSHPRKTRERGHENAENAENADDWL